LIIKCVMGKIVKLNNVGVVNLAPHQEGVWAGDIAPRTLKLDNIER
jgi:hypothetical protein